MIAISNFGEWQPLRWLRMLGFGAALLLPAASGFSQNGDLPGVMAQAEDVRVEGELSHDIQVSFDWQRSVKEATLGDSDITVTGPLGYAQRGQLISVREVPGPLPLPADAAGNGEFPELAAGVVPQPVPVVVATYRVFPSASHDGPWSPEQNGPYAIYLNAGEVATAAGEFYPPALIGGFRVALGVGEPVLPDEVRITIVREPSLLPDGGGIVGTSETLHARVELVFASQNVEVTDWGSVAREGNGFSVTVKAFRIPGVAPAGADGAIGPDRVFTHRYPLGMLAVGDYRFVVRSQNQRIGLEEFRVEAGGTVDVMPPVAVLVAGAVNRGGDAWHDLRVTYEDASGVDLGTLGASDLRVFNATRCALNAAGICADTGHLPLLFVAAQPTGNDLRKVEALYRVGPPSGGWTPEANGFYTVILGEGQVCDLRGNCNSLRTLGGFAVEIQDPPPGAGTASLTVNAFDPTQVTARVEVVLDGCFAIGSQSLRREGNRFFLSANALPTPCPPPSDPNDIPPPHTEVLDYALGAPAEGSYVAVFLLNGRQLAAASFFVGGEPPVPAKATIAVDTSSPSRVLANVHVDFDGHFAITGQSIRREGSTVFLLATAEEQAVIAIFPPPPPVPADLSYEIGALTTGNYRAVFVLNGRNLADIGFLVGPTPPVPATARLVVDSANPANVVATVTLQFADHYRIASQSVRREGTRFLLVGVPEGPLPILAPLPPQPITLSYELGAVEPGLYSAAFSMREHVYAGVEFKIGGDGEPVFPAEVALLVETAGTRAVLHAVVDFEDPYVVMVENGIPRREERRFTIDAKAARANFFAEPDGAPVRLSYDLGTLDPGKYVVLYRINGATEARIEFLIAPPPLPHIAFIEISEGNASHFAKVGVVLDRPDLQVLDWGAVRREGNGFAVEIRVGTGNDTPDPAGEGVNGVPDGFGVDASGNPVLGGLPVRLVAHDYGLGVLAPGEYSFLVTSGGVPVARKGFAVRGAGPMAVLRAEDIAQAGAEAKRFTVHYSDPDGLDHEAIRGATVSVTGPDGFRAVATLREYVRSEDVPSSGATADYAIIAPGGRWDAADNGRYRISVEASAVRDRLGNPLANGALGSFEVRIVPEVPGGGGSVAISVQLAPSGDWIATVAVLVPGVTVTEWGEVARNGQVMLAMATAARLEPNLFPPGGAVETTHTYRLGELGPGHYRFVFKTSLGHCGQAIIEVPGIPRDAVDAWIDLAGGEREGWNAVEAFAFALRPNGTDVPLVSPEIIRQADQREHFGVRFRRLLGAVDLEYILECSADMRTWQEAGESAEIVNREIDIDGTETVHLCLRATMVESAIRYLRIVVRRVGR